jgi:nucleotide-binding universal stress UspA family protein
MFDTILVPTDGSDHADKAVAIASDLAAQHGSRLVLLHVTDGSLSTRYISKLVDSERISHWGTSKLERLELIIRSARATVGTSNASIQMPGTLLEEVETVLLSDAEAVAREHRVRLVNRYRKSGDAVTRILESAKEEGADVIVMGSRGLSHVEGPKMGHVSQKVSHLAACKCVVVN